MGNTTLSHKRLRHYYRCFLVTLVLAGVLTVSLLPGVSQAADSQANWHDTGHNLPAQLNNPAATFPTAHGVCVDGSQPSTLVLNRIVKQGENYSPSLGSAFAFNWSTGVTTRLNDHPFDFCTESGYYYTYGNGQLDALRYSLAEPEGRPIQYMPDNAGVGGSQWVYAGPRMDNGRLFASSDAGLTWQERFLPFPDKLINITVMPGDGRSIYAAALVGGGTTNSSGGVRYAIYFSANGGESWEKRLEDTAYVDIRYIQQQFQLKSVSSRAGGVDTFIMAQGVGVAGSGAHIDYYLSTDGGRSFNMIGSSGLGLGVRVVKTQHGLVRLVKTPYGFTFSNSSDGGKSWQGLNLPFTPVEAATSGLGENFMDLRNASNSPDNLILTGTSGSLQAGGETRTKLWYSSNGGKSWRVLDTPYSFLITPYAPTTAVGFGSDKRIYTLDMSEGDKSLPVGANPASLAGASYYVATRHNLWGVFKDYWEGHGGLAQFGYPRTEPFREVNPADGKVYLVQYFERNRLEYHPENAGTPYLVLLGLLGNQLTEVRRQSGDGAFNRFDNQNYPGGTYFPQTGHNLRNSFKDYWELHGGLALYGYPISEEFYEVNPDDGETYVVQYFERNRFEYHPENKGNQYEVLLGLLGNTLLKNKGWSQ